MENSRYDPELIHRRRLIINLVIVAIILALLIYGWAWVTHYHRTSSARQQELLTSNEPTVVMFYSKTCPACRQVAFTANRAALSGKVSGELRSLTGDPSKKHQVMFVEYQNKQDEKLFAKYNVTRKPTLMVLKQGQPQVIGNKNGLPVYQYVGNGKSEVKDIYHNLQVNSLLK